MMRLFCPTGYARFSSFFYIVTQFKPIWNSVWENSGSPLNIDSAVRFGVYVYVWSSIGCNFQTSKRNYGKNTEIWISPKIRKLQESKKNTNQFRSLVNVGPVTGHVCAALAPDVAQCSIFPCTTGAHVSLYQPQLFFYYYGRHMRFHRQQPRSFPVHAGHDRSKGTQGLPQ